MTAVEPEPRLRALAVRAAATAPVPGRIVEIWGIEDTAERLHQLGLS